MEGYQFAHVEVYSVKGMPGAKAGQVNKRKNGQRAWTAKQVLDEAERVELASEHVIPGRPGAQVVPATSSNFTELRAAHTAAASVKETMGYATKDGKKGTRRRKLRADAASLYASVYSLPVRSEEALADEELRQHCVTVLRTAVDAEKDRIELLGGTVELGAIHWDEEFVHVHIYALDRKMGRVDHLHPGRAAKSAFHNNHRSEADRGEANKAANSAYCEAMRGWQDHIYKCVSKDAGLLRYGPKRERLSTSDYKKAKAAAASREDDEKRHENLEAQTTKLVQLKKSVEAASKEVNETGKRVVAQQKHADDAFAAGKDLQASAEAKQVALIAGMTAVDDRVIDYHEATPQRARGIHYGANAPQTEEDRRRLVDRLRPAYDFIVSYAEKVFRLRTRQKAIEERERRASAEAEKLAVGKTEIELKRAQADADQRNKARILAEAEKMIWKHASAPVMMLLDPNGKALDESSFPDAWPVATDADPTKLQATLDQMPNLTLKSLISATNDAFLLSEEAPDIHSRFGRGLAILRKEAAARGFDAETGRNDPAKAKDPARARLHTDQEERRKLTPAHNANRGRERVRGD